MFVARSFARLKPSVSPSLLLNRTLYISPRLLQDDNPPSSTPNIFVPTPSTAKEPFRQSPIKNEVYAPQTPQYRTENSVDDYASLQRIRERLLVSTGPISGRTVECRRDRFGMALAQLARILKANNVRRESEKYKERNTPHTVREVRRSQNHRRRFAQGVARMANIVLRMRRKSY
jgi:small subunit ribosomal protein MRP21